MKYPPEKLAPHPVYTGLAWANWGLIPDGMIPGLRRYIEDGIEPGSFLRAVLCNDLREACGRADDNNVNRLHHYIQFLYNYAPRGCWGSPDNYMDWIKMGGLNGVDRDA